MCTCASVHFVKPCVRVKKRKVGSDNEIQIVLFFIYNSARMLNTDMHCCRSHKSDTYRAFT